MSVATVFLTLKKLQREDLDRQLLLTLTLYTAAICFQVVSLPLPPPQLWDFGWLVGWLVTATGFRQATNHLYTTFGTFHLSGGHMRKADAQCQNIYESMMYVNMIIWHHCHHVQAWMTMTQEDKNSPRLEMWAYIPRLSYLYGMNFVQTVPDFDSSPLTSD